MQIEKDYYESLELEPGADDHQIKEAFRRLARRYHPDISHEIDAEERFIEVQRAYEVLGDPDRRKAYNRWREEQGLGRTSFLRLEITTAPQTLFAIPEEQLFYSHLEILPARKAAVERFPLNICLVLDQSTSMKGEKLDQLKDATLQLMSLLHPEDTCSLVTFSDRATVIFSGHRGVPKGSIPSTIAAISAYGGTEIYQGLRAGLDQILLQRFGQSIDHLVLFTDGQTYGDEENCLELAREAAQHQVSISAMGLGHDWNDALLDKIAAQSGGVSTLIETAGQIKTVFREKVQGMQSVFAQNVRLVLRHTQGIHLRKAHRVFPRIEQLRSDGGYLAIGDLESEAPATFLLEWVLDPHPSGQHHLCSLVVEAELAGRERRSEKIERALEVHIKEGREEGKPVFADTILRALEQIAAFRLQNKVQEDLAAGRTAEATQRLNNLATRLLSLGEKDLARAALLEAARLTQTGRLSEEGKKRLKYGTRRLSQDMEKRPL